MLRLEGHQGAAGPVESTQEAIDKGYRARETEEFAILSLAGQGWITGPGRCALRLQRDHHQLPGVRPAALTSN